MYKFSSLFFLCLLPIVLLNAQYSKHLDPYFTKYEIVEINADAVYQSVKQQDFIKVTLPKGKLSAWELDLTRSSIISDSYLSQYVDASGQVRTGQPTSAIPTQGIVKGQSQSSVSLTFNEGFIYGYIKDSNGYSFVEPLYYYDKSAPENLFVVYHDTDVKPQEEHTCGATKMYKKSRELQDQSHDVPRLRMDGECFEVQYAIANDFLMFSDLGSIAAVENHAIGVTNNVQTNYDDEFADELQLIIVTQFTVTTSSGDPWSSTTDAGALLDSFTDWGPNGFGTTHDIGSLWTDRNFDGSTIGIAWLGVVCTSNRYNCLQNFTTNPNTKRVMVAHEIGHNFDAEHDGSGSGFIMAPSVNTSTTWSAPSISNINQHVASRWCLSNCAGSGAAPVADFDFNYISDCTPGEVAFTNTSTGASLTYNWVFQGGTPSVSTAKDPVVSYLNAGIFDVTLTVTNPSGQDVLSLNNIIEIDASPNVDFGYATNGTIVSFFNFTTNATSYFWDFGDGIFSSNSDPVHDYIDDGIYTVNLTATGICGDVTYTEIIVIANPPTASFTYSTTSGCAPFTVDYTSTSSNNTDSYFWTFEGGSPATSTLQNPSVSYTTAGSFDVSLTVINETGDDILTFTDLIQAEAAPVADFTYVINGNTVAFTNLSSGLGDVMWLFGDGSSSTELNPTHTYAQDGTFTVVLDVTNDCGSNSVSTTFDISIAPIASFVVSDISGCAPFVTTFTSTSSNAPTTYLWTFPGGSPSTSTLENPQVTYATSGTFDVSLTVSNANGSNSISMDDVITVNDVPVSGFGFTEDGLNVVFQDMSIGASTYFWQFGDGNSSTVQNPEHTYQQEGNYTVSLTVENECGQSIQTSTINNYTPVTAAFSSNMSTGCSPLTISFEDLSSTNVTSWLWTFEGGSPSSSTLPNPTVVFNNAGTYDVTLTVSHPESTASVTMPDFISVLSVPTTSFDYFDDVFVVNFTNTSDGGETFNWDFGDGNTSTQENPVNTYTTEGVYTVTLTTSNACGSTSSSQDISIDALPTAGVSAAATSGCGPFSVDFQDVSSSNVTAWLWTFEGGTPSTSNDPNPTVIFANKGSYDVTLEVSSSAGSDVLFLPDYITVLGTPEASFTIQQQGVGIEASYAGNEGTATWSVEGMEISGNDLSYDFSSNGTYLVTLTVTNQCGSDTKSQEISISAFPTAMVSSDLYEGCVNQPLELVDNSTNATSWEWNLQGSQATIYTDQNPQVLYTEPGIYDLFLTVTNAFGSNSISLPGAIVIGELPTANITFTDNGEVFDFQANGTGSSYLWDFGDGKTSTEKNPSHTYTSSGNYTVVLVVTNECGSTSTSELINVIVSSSKDTDLESVKIYPVPTQDILFIDLPISSLGNVNVSMYDNQGRSVLSTILDSNSNSIDISAIMQGVYFVRLQSGKGIFYKKIIVL